MKHSVVHDLGQDKAKQVAVAAFDSYKKRFAEYSPTADWVSDRRADIAFKVKGISLTGSLEVGPKSIDMDLDVPFLLRPFKGKALGVVEQEIRRWIGKANAGQL
ncbi:MAG TPA: polyhydroxyalkanoic acid system family protein [Polyangiaceae bacterium]|jgi:hypothetical protein